MKKKLNPWIEMSIEYANQRSYLDDLFQVYPTVPEGIRDIDDILWKDVERAFRQRNNVLLLENLLKLDLFPIKDSYVAYLKRDREALKRNPATADRLAGRLYEMGINEIFSRSSEPKETNRQIGPLFKRWLNKKSLGIAPLDLDKFLRAKGNAILDASDAEMMAFAREHLNYRHNKGLDALATVRARGVKAITVAILDGVLYIESKNKMYKDITGRLKDENIMSALVLREFLYQV